MMPSVSHVAGPFIIYLRVRSVFANEELPHSLLPLDRIPLFHMLELI